MIREVIYSGGKRWWSSTNHPYQDAVRDNDNYFIRSRKGSPLEFNSGILISTLLQLLDPLVMLWWSLCVVCLQLFYSIRSWNEWKDDQNFMKRESFRPVIRAHENLGMTQARVKNSWILQQERWLKIFWRTLELLPSHLGLFAGHTMVITGWS